MTERLPYPDTRRDDVIDTLHGVDIADPYRWLEDLESDATADWIGRQNEVTESFLSGVTERAAIRERLDSFEAELGELEPGDYWYPFQLTLPTYLPESLQMQNHCE